MSLRLRDELGKTLEDRTIRGDDLGLEAEAIDSTARVLSAGVNGLRDDAGAVVDHLLAELEGGADRGRVVRAIGGELQMALGLCGDRRDALARAILDRALETIRREAIG